MKEVKLGIVTYTYNEDGSVTRNVDETAKAEIELKLKEKV
jgi:hypothetical protein